MTANRFLPADLHDAARNGARRLTNLGHRAELAKHFGLPAVRIITVAKEGLLLLPRNGRRGSVYREAVGTGSRYQTVHIAVAKEILNRTVGVVDDGFCLRYPRQWCPVCGAVLMGKPPFTKGAHHDRPRLL